MTVTEEAVIQDPHEMDAFAELNEPAGSGGLEGSGEPEGSRLPADLDALATGELGGVGEGEAAAQDDMADSVAADGVADDEGLANRDSVQGFGSSRFDVEALSDIAKRMSQAASFVDATQIAHACKMADAAALTAFPGLAKGRAAGALATKAASASAERVARTAVEGALKVAARRVVDAAASAASAVQTDVVVEAVETFEAVDGVQADLGEQVIAHGEAFPELADGTGESSDAELACESCVETRGTSSEEKD